jgi:signal transduction histidine kinase
MAVAAEVMAGTRGRLAPGPRVLQGIAAAGVVAAGASVALALSSDHVNEPVVQSGLIDWITLPYILSGVIAWWRRPQSRLGPLMVAAGFVTFLSTLQWTSVDVPFTVGQTLDLVPVALFLHVFLAFPSGRLERRFERWLVIASYAMAIGLELVGMAIGGFGPHNLLEVTSYPGAAQTLERVQLVGLSTLSLAGIGVLAARRRRTGRPLRRSLSLLTDSFALGLVMIPMLLMSAIWFRGQFVPIQRATFAVIGLAPIAFLIGLVHARLARSGVGDLLVRLRSDLSPTAQRDALARALRDPSLELAYWLPEFDSWSDLDGQRVELPEPGSARAMTPIDRDGERMAILLHDPGLEEERELLAAVGAAAGIALENGRLHAEQKAHLEELKGSRARVIEAGQRERQRLERNLHDGAQQRLVALSLELSMLEKQMGDDADARARLDQARREIAISLDELRAVARGLHPAVLSGHGLEVALQSIVAGAPVSVRLAVGFEDRLPEQIEVAAFYVVSESLANIGKHAQAASATVDVTRLGGMVVVEIVDDGVGGADSDHGTGLRGLADRVEALGGTLRVWSPAGRGTRLRAEMPCA